MRLRTKLIAATAVLALLAGVVLADGYMQGPLPAGVPVTTNPVYIGGSDGTNLRGLSTDATGNLNVNSGAKTIAGTITTNGGTVTLVVLQGGASSVAIQLSGVWTATFVFEASVDNSTWFGISGTGATTATSFMSANGGLGVNGQWIVSAVGCYAVRVRTTAYTSGTLSVQLTALPGLTTIMAGQDPVSTGYRPITATVGAAPIGGAVGIPFLVSDGALFRFISAETASGATSRIQPGDSSRATYSAGSTGSFTATGLTDVVRIIASATKTAKIRHIEFGVTQTTANSLAMYIVKRSTADTGGTFVTDTILPFDPSDAAGTVTVGHYTAAATGLGTSLGIIRSFTQISGAYQLNFSGDFGSPKSSKPIFLGSASTQEIDINISGTGGASFFTYSIEWTEE